ncbi:MAG: GTP-binding protein [Candidatus Freyarchaeota archaeon]|nr:GTP-binding protein [Candidatus Jordarchaeia archaeon]
MRPLPYSVRRAALTTGKFRWLRMIRLRLPLFDRQLGGIPASSKNLFMISPSFDPSILGLHIVRAGLEEGYRVVYFVNNKPPLSVKRQARRSRLNVEAYEQKGQFVMVDAYSMLSGAESPERCVVNPYDVSSVKKVLADLSSEKTLLVLDSLNSLLESLGGEVGHIMDVLNATDASTLAALFSSWTYMTELLEEMENFFNGVFEVKPDPLFIVENQLRAKKASWIAKARSLSFLVKVVSPSELRVYLPKVVVVGPYNAGKTTLIHALAEDAVSVERMGTTVALDHGSLDYKGFYMELFGTPGQPQFEPILDMMMNGAVGLILVVDSADASSFERARELFKKCEGKAPMVVAANKQDLESAIPPGELRARLKLPPSIPVVGCSAKNRVNIFLLLDILLNMLST